MSGWLYLIRNRDLYKIGITKNFENRMLQLKPDHVVAKHYTSDFVKLERELHNRYKKFRIPQTEYFRLENYHLKEIKQIFSRLNYPMSITLSIFIQSLLLILLIFVLIFIFIYLYINDTNIVIYKSFVWMERITFGFSFISLLVPSRKYLSFWNELKYRISQLTVFILFSFFFRVSADLLH